MSNRDYEYEKHESDFESRAYLRGLLRYTVKSIESLNELEASGSREAQEEFKQNVSGLSKFYFFKYPLSDDVERPEVLESDDLYGPANLTKVPLNDVREVFYSIMHLQEELGHTKLESLRRGRRQI